MLPIPFLKYIPKLFRGDAVMQSLATKVDTNLNAWKKDVIDINRLQRVDEAPSAFVVQLGYLLNANIQPFDSDLQRRKKTRDAISTHKIRGTWIADVKIRIDNITGLDAVIFRSFDGDDWILTGDGLTPPAFYWASMGADGIDDRLGIALIGEGTEVEVAGNIYINVHDGINVATLTSDQVTQIVQEIEDDVVPAYYRVNIGYIDVTGAFIIYPGGNIQ